VSVGQGLFLAVAAAVWTTGYVLACGVWPFARCTKCEGAGKAFSPRGQYWKPCKRCSGSGKRLRTGRRVWLVLRGRT
jgi:hypothetical protein